MWVSPWSPIQGHHSPASSSLQLPPGTSAVPVSRYQENHLQTRLKLSPLPECSQYPHEITVVGAKGTMAKTMTATEMSRSGHKWLNKVWYTK